MQKTRMISLMRSLLFMGVFLVVLTGGNALPVDAQEATTALPPPPECPASIGFGETIHCAITGAGEIDIYSFPGIEGDHIYLRMSSPSGSPWPYVHIHKPDGSYLCGAVNVTGHYTVDTDCTLPVTGTYTVWANDYGGTGEGEYYLYMQRANNPGSPVSMNFGDTLAGTILTPAQNDTYTFSGTANDRVLVRLTAASYAQILIYNPDGTILCSSDGNTSRQDVTCTLPATGTYTILAGAGDGLGTGAYHIFLQRLNNPGSASTITYGQILPGTITAPAEMDAFFFSGEAGDLLVARMGTTSAVYAYLNVYNPDGTKLCGAYTAWNGSKVELDCTLTSTGIHTILASDHDATDTGDYQVYIQRLNGPGLPVPMNFGPTQSCRRFSLSPSEGERAGVRGSAWLWSSKAQSRLTGRKVFHRLRADPPSRAACSLPAPLPGRSRSPPARQSSTPRKSWPPMTSASRSKRPFPNARSRPRASLASCSSLTGTLITAGMAPFPRPISRLN